MISSKDRKEQKIMIKLTFKDHGNQETKVVKGFSWNMLPSGSYEVKTGCFSKEIISAKRYYLAKVESI